MSQKMKSKNGGIYVNQTFEIPIISPDGELSGLQLMGCKKKKQ